MSTVDNLARLSSFATWTFSPSTTPSSVASTSIDPTNASELAATITSAVEVLMTASGWRDVISYSRIVRGAKASLDIISAQQVLATATDTGVQAQATAVIENNVLNLQDLLLEKSLYNYFLKAGPNILFFVIFTIVFLYNTLMSIKSKYYWYNVTYFCGYGLEFCGFLGRVLSIDKNNTSNENFYLLQFISLTLAPAFIMAGIYFLFAQTVVIFGRQYSVLKPLWYSYFFITIDVLSLMVQAGGGGAASAASTRQENTKPGTNTVIAGIAFQVVGMTVFVGFWFEFLHRIFFKHRKEVQTDSPFTKRSFVSFFKMLLNTKSAREYQSQYLEPFRNPKFAAVRARKLFGYMPLAMTVSVLVIYIRCVYRVVELAEGFQGHLISTEYFLFALDAVMIAIAGMISIPFHPVWVFGKENLVKLATIKRNLDEFDEKAEQEGEEEVFNNDSQPDEYQRFSTSEKGVDAPHRTMA